nr:hypothetical protein BdHM001_22780 [Bdellovibrio sp. HM001]
MLRLSCLIAALILSWGGLAQARFGGDEKGNGGSVIDCPQNNPWERYEVLDLYEAREVQTFKLDLIEAYSYQDVLAKMINRLEEINPTRARLYRSYAKTFEQETRMISGAEFTDVPDRGWGALPKGCRLVQGAVQYKRPSIAGHRYYINKDVWDGMNNTQRAALALHEIIYREGLLPENGFQSSNGVRLLNGYLHSTNMRNVTLKKYVDLIQRSGLQAIDIQGYPVILHGGGLGEEGDYTVEFYDSEVVKRAVLARQVELPAPQGKTAPFLCGPEAKGPPAEINFYASGVIQRVRPRCSSVGFVIYSRESYGQITAYEVNYDIEGRMTSAMSFQFELNHPDYHLRSSKIGGLIEFYPTGEPRRAFIGRHFSDATGSWVRIDEVGQDLVALQKNDVLFDQTGRIVELNLIPR